MKYIKQGQFTRIIYNISKYLIGLELAQDVKRKNPRSTEPMSAGGNRSFSI